MAEKYTVYLDVDLKLAVKVLANSEDEAIELAEEMSEGELLKGEIIDISTIIATDAQKS